MVRFLRPTALACALAVSAAVNASAQAPPLVFTLAAPEPERLAADVHIHASAAVAERGLALWSGSSSDFGIGIDVNGRRWMVHSTTNITLLPIGREPRPTFQQLEIARKLFSTATASVAGGGGVRQESDGTRAVIGRALMTAQVAGGRLQGSFVMERVVSSPMRRDAADVTPFQSTIVGSPCARWPRAGALSFRRGLQPRSCRRCSRTHGRPSRS